MPCSSTVATAQPGEAFFPPRTRFPLLLLAVHSHKSPFHSHYLSEAAECETHIRSPRYDPHQAVVSRKIFRLEPHPFSARFGYKYVDRQRGLMMIFSQAQRDEMKTITRGTWPLGILFWLCGFKDEAASPGSAVVFASPGEQFFPRSDSLSSKFGRSHGKARLLFVR